MIYPLQYSIFYPQFPSISTITPSTFASHLLKKTQLIHIISMKNQQSQTSDLAPRLNIPLSYFYPDIHIKTWQLYAKRRGKHAENQSYDKQLEPIATIYTLEEFFKYYNSLKLPSEYEVDVKLMLFEEKCKPKWEDWPESGCLLLQFKEAKESIDADILDKIWEYLIFSMVGNQLDSEIIGICLSKHQKQTLVEVWLRNSHKKIQIGKRIEELIQRDLQYICVKLKRPIKVGYKEHKLSIEKNSTMKGTQKLVTIQSNRSS